MLDDNTVSSAAKTFVEYNRTKQRYDEAKKQLKAEQEALEKSFWKNQGGLYQRFQEVEANWANVRQNLQEEREASYVEHGNDPEVYGDVLQIRCTYKPEILDAEETVRWLKDNGLGGFIVEIPSNSVLVNVKEDMKAADKANPHYSPLSNIPDHLVSRNKKYALVVKEGFADLADLTPDS